MKILPIRVKNQFWSQCGHNVMGLVTEIENKRFQGMPEDDIDYGKLLFNMTGMIREIERLQIENNNLQIDIDNLVKNECSPPRDEVEPTSPIEEKQDQPAADVITD